MRMQIVVVVMIIQIVVAVMKMQIVVVHENVDSSSHSHNNSSTNGTSHPCHTTGLIYYQLTKLIYYQLTKLIYYQLTKLMQLTKLILCHTDQKRISSNSKKNTATHSNAESMVQIVVVMKITKVIMKMMKGIK